MARFQVRSKSLSEDGSITISVVEAENVQHLSSGTLAFLDAGDVIVALLQKDSWIDVVRIP